MIALRVVLIALLVGLAAPPTAGAALRAGVGKADVTPPRTGYYLGGWTRADRRALGQHTRLHARTMVLEHAGKKVALVSLDLFMIPAGMQQQVAELNAERGFTEQNVLISPTHTHSGPGGYANLDTYNTAAPSIETVGDPTSFTDFFQPAPADPQLYTFITRQIAESIRRADADLAPAAAGWANGKIVGLTRNRSVEAHLANHGIDKPPTTGSPAEDPDGAEHTIAPDVDVLRVDKLKSVRRCRRGKCRRVRTRIPIGAWSNFANHGTVTKAEFQAYGGDHHASAHRVFEARVRKAGRVPASQEVLNVYGNAEEGDQSAGLDHTGPAGADEVGRVEAAAMLEIWRRARRKMTTKPKLDLRWTRACFCGRQTAKGRVASRAVPGIPFLTGSEEGRGPLFDVTRTSFEGRKSPRDDPEQGHKIAVDTGEFPTAVPLTVIRIGDRVIASLPGEPTKEVGARVKQAVWDESKSLPIRRVIIAGLANDFLSYITTPEEYGQQHYEGGSTLYGPLESVFLTERLADLAARMTRGEPAPAPDPFDAQNGVRPDGPSYPPGADSGSITEQPGARTGRLEQARLRWQGAPNGADRPVDAAFVIVERRERGGAWREVDSDLGLSILWRVDDQGRYDAVWEVPFNAPLGEHRLRIAAAGYALTSRPFEVVAAGSIAVRRVDAAPGRVAVALEYPVPRENLDLTFRPRRAEGGVVAFRVGGRTVEVPSKSGEVFSVAAPGGAAVSVPAGAAKDRFGNGNAEPLAP